MKVKQYDITATESWSALKKLTQSIRDLRITELFAADSKRVEKYSLKCAGIYLDFSKNLVDENVRNALMGLLSESPFEEQREAMFRGYAINTTEQRPVLHTALRSDRQMLAEDGLENLGTQIEAQKQHIKEVSDKIRSGNWRGSTGKLVTDVINLGIGGSDLGPRMVCEALKEFAHPSVRCHFVSNVDGELIKSTLKKLDPETTLVIISSKTFTTQETLLNANTAATWFRERLSVENPYATPHFIGVTASPENAVKLGVLEENLLEFWDWVGGRYSLWSSIGLSIAICLGYERFQQLLDGASEMDKHFRSSAADQNMPVIMALLGLWYTDFFDAESQAVIPYCQRMVEFPTYLQQLDMESNGKSVMHDGSTVKCATGPIVWGQTGTNGQHSFFQLLHQGTHLVPVDFIGVLKDKMSSPDHHRVLLANMLAQSAALMQGKQSAESEPYRHYPGNRPSNVMLLDELSPYTLGALIALYEHKVFVQGCLWNVNSFDQWGVELGKVLAGQLLDEESDKSDLDDSTRTLLAAVDAAL